MIIALAGHVDHGKTSLVRALTGTDTDRLAEERRRGMTIELGFAYGRDGNGAVQGFVDVPGHERFFGTALSGLLGAQAALLAVAADDGPMPQTLEHLDVLRLIGVRRMIVAVTKADRVEPDRTASVAAEVAALLHGAGYAEAPVIPVSAVTGDGLQPLRTALAALAAPPAAGGRFRMQIDRAFTLQGIGLVVTGTVLAGSAAPGDLVLLSPGRVAARIRSLEIAGAPAQRATAGQRAACAITGARLERSVVSRGDWLLAPTLHSPTVRLDAHLTAVQTLRHGEDVLAHLGAAESGGRVLLPGGSNLTAGTAGFAHILLHRPLPALHGDRLILRTVRSGRLAAGGRIIDPFPPARREAPAIRQARLAAQLETKSEAALPALLRAVGSVDLAAFALARNIDDAEAAEIARSSGALVRNAAALAPASHVAVRERMLGALARWHAEHQDRIGLPKPVLLAAAPGHAAAVAEAVLDLLREEGAVVQDGAALRLASHRPRLQPQDAALWQRLHPLLVQGALRPPRVRELTEPLGLAVDEVEALLTRLDHFGLLVRVAPNRAFLPETVEALGRIAHALAAESEDGTFPAAAFNARSGIGRNLTIEVLEYLDRAGVTRRLGEVRCLADRHHDAAPKPDRLTKS